MSGFTQIPNTLLDRTDLDVYEHRAMMIIARKTMGWGKQTDGIPHSQFMDAMQSSKHTVIKAIGSLESKGLIEVIRSQRFQGKQGWNKYRFTDAVVNEANPHLQSAPDAPRNTQSAPDTPRQSAPDAPSEPLQGARRAHSKETLISSKETHSKEEQTATANAFAVCVSESFQSLWESSPLPKVNKQKAAKAWDKACKGRSLEKIASGLQLLTQDLAERAAHVEGYESPFWKTHLSTYISKETWKDEDMPQRFGKIRGASDGVERQLNEAQAHSRA